MISKKLPCSNNLKLKKIKFWKLRFCGAVRQRQKNVAEFLEENTIVAARWRLSIRVFQQFNLTSMWF